MTEEWKTLLVSLTGAYLTGWMWQDYYGDPALGFAVGTVVFVFSWPMYPRVSAE